MLEGRKKNKQIERRSLFQCFFLFLLLLCVTAVEKAKKRYCDVCHSQIQGWGSWETPLRMTRMLNGEIQWQLHYLDRQICKQKIQNHPLLQIIYRWRVLHQPQSIDLASICNLLHQEWEQRRSKDKTKKKSTKESHKTHTFLHWECHERKIGD